MLPIVPPIIRMNAEIFNKAAREPPVIISEKSSENIASNKPNSEAKSILYALPQNSIFYSP
ncbi:MAG TPA: hypothetical protein GXX43_10180 [Tepidanaerobacter syntrophicus]|nr:hypothetical protein [Tepidanaerobacter syntrophicus]